MKPLVSVCCITYNHEKFIGDCIQGFLFQKTSFPFEILIFDDASNDRTQSIIKEYAIKYSNIKTFLQSENQWVQKKYGLLEWLLPNARGKYIALCEGDDYWSDPNKLQKQINILESDSNIAISFHNIYQKTLSGKIENVSRNNLPEHPATFDLECLAKGNFIYTLSVVFRNFSFLKQLPDWFVKAPIGDYPLYMLLAQHGKIHYLPESMAVYRIHQGGVWSTQSGISNLNNYIKVLELLITHPFDNHIRQLLKSQFDNLLYELIKKYFLEGRQEEVVVKIQELIIYDKERVINWLNVRYPALITEILNSDAYKVGSRLILRRQKHRNLLLGPLKVITRICKNLVQ